MKNLNTTIANNFRLPRLGLGCVSESNSEGVQTIDVALERGISYLNIGDFYGNGDSEIMICEALKTCRRNRTFVNK